MSDPVLCPPSRDGELGTAAATTLELCPPASASLRAGAAFSPGVLIVIMAWV
jgi:hypothetical protein